MSGTYQTRLPVFSYQVLRDLEAQPGFEELRGGHWLLAVSGGLDSMVMWDLVMSWQARLNIRVSVAHVHHGRSTQPELVDYRKRAFLKVQAQAEALGCSFYSNYAETMSDSESCAESASEEELRDFRHGFLEKWKQDINADVVVLAHHKLDQLETRMIRLIRGCEASGMIAMKMVETGKLRPLLESSIEQVKEYAALKKLNFVEDPSNADTRFLRNWLRRVWLPQLEQYRPGGIAALTRSLENIAQSSESSLENGLGQSRADVQEISLPQFLQENESGQRQWVARYLSSIGVDKFTQGQVVEICKRLLSSRKTDSFRVAGCQWEINAGQVRAWPVVISQG